MSQIISSFNSRIRTRQSDDNRKEDQTKRIRRSLTPLQDRDEEAQILTDDDYEEYKNLRQENSQKHAAKFLASRDFTPSPQKKKNMTLRGRSNKPPAFDDDDDRRSGIHSPTPKSNHSIIYSPVSAKMAERVKSLARSRIANRESVSLNLKD